RDNNPTVLPVSQPLELVLGNEYGLVDYSNCSQGYIRACSYLAGARMKILVNAPDGRRYQYALEQYGEFATIPLNGGNGSYQIVLYEHVRDNLYKRLTGGVIDVQLDDAMLPYLYPNQRVDFGDGDAATALSAEVTAVATDDLQAVDNIYSWVLANVEYDFLKAEQVSSGYIASCSETILSKKGICLDYAALTVAMLRAQSIPAKLVVGYYGNTYHAWVEVWLENGGRGASGQFYESQGWTLLDPTTRSQGVTSHNKPYVPMLEY
ncbi:MAG: transglutaminase-like domain-containing protein, partial [Coriobacteriales bacterium]|nr:transglutaminase-like domain-containing protein [Coriobacteriales bacterium]